MLKKFLLILILVIFTVSCKTSKQANTATKKEKKMLTQIISSYQNTQFNEKTVRATVRAKYTGKTKLPSVKVSLRMEKDKVIWMNISKSILKVGKLKITPKRVQFYSVFQRQYFDGDFSLLSEFLGANVDFKQVQSILLGEAVYDLNKRDFTIKKNNEVVQFTPKKQNKLFDILFWLNTSNTKINKQEINQTKEAKQLIITYPRYEKVENVFFPKEIDVVAKDAKNSNLVNLEFKNVVFNEDLSFPFSFPKGYKEIKI